MKLLTYESLSDEDRAIIDEWAEEVASIGTSTKDSFISGFLLSSRGKTLQYHNAERMRAVVRNRIYHFRRINNG